MKKILLLSSLVALTSCAISVTHDSTSIKKISEEKLANGTVTRVGFTRPTDEWHCKQIDRKADSWSIDQMQGMLNWGGAYKVLQDQAIAYANQKQLKPNYIFLYVPTQGSVNNFNMMPLSEAEADYYQCKAPPAVSNRMF